MTSLERTVRGESKTVLVVGDPRCCLTYINDPNYGVARSNDNIRANCLLVGGESEDLFNKGKLSYVPLRFIDMVALHRLERVLASPCFD